MSWVFFAALGYLFQAVSVLGDKLILGKILPRPASYAFWQGILSLGVLVFVPLGFSLLPGQEIIVSFLAGGFWLYGLFFFFNALLLADASRVQPIILSLTPLFLFGLESFGLKTVLSKNEIIAAILLVSGSIILSLDFGKKGERIFKKFILFSLAAAVLFALSLFFMKQLFLKESFFNILIWTRFGLFLGGLSLLFFAKNRRAIFSSSKIMRRPKASGGVVLNKLFGAFGALFVYFALSRGPATLVNALQGLQYAFLFIIALFLSLFFPKIIKESFDKKEILQKIMGMIFVSLGLFFLAYEIF